MEKIETWNAIVKEQCNIADKFIEIATDSLRLQTRMRFLCREVIEYLKEEGFEVILKDCYLPNLDIYNIYWENSTFGKAKKARDIVVNSQYDKLKACIKIKQKENPSLISIIGINCCYEVIRRNICFFLSCAAIIALYMVPEARKDINEMMLIWLPYFTFIMYAINRGTGFTKALFMNCDHSLLTYSFYKQPACILKLFRIRLREIMKVNALPAIVIGAGLSAILYVSGGTENPLNYAVLFISILCMSMFFSIHYLTIYYLLQPYNAGTEIKSGMYQIIMSATYLVCFGLMQVRLPILVFGIACIAFCIVYSAVACVLVYRLAPKTFRLRV